MKKQILSLLKVVFVVGFLLLLFKKGFLSLEATKKAQEFVGAEVRGLDVGVLLDLARRADRDDAPEVEHEDEVTDAHDEVDVVLDEQHAEALTGQVEQQVTEPLCLALVEAGQILPGMA